MAAPLHLVVIPAVAPHALPAPAKGWVTQASVAVSHVRPAVALQSAQVFTKPELTLLVAAVLKCKLEGLLS